MRGYTLKLFWWFWLTAATAGLAHHATTMLTDGRLFHEQMMENVREIALVYGERVAARAARDGPEKAGSYLERLRRDHRFFAFLFDDEGKILLDQNPPDHIVRMAAEARRTKEPSIRMERGRPVFAVPLEDYPGFVFAGRMINPYFDRRSLPVLRLMAAVLAAGLLSWILASRLAKPIRKLRGAVQRLAAGELDARAETTAKRSDEIGELAKDFNRMADRMETLLRGQRRLLADVSHELRSPLTRLGVGLELLRRRSTSPDDEAFGRMETELGRIESLIASLLKLARLEALEQPEKRAPTDLTALLEEIASDAAFEAEALGVEVATNLAEGVSLSVDSGLLHSAVENVVRNALRYTSARSAKTETALAPQGTLSSSSLAGRGIHLVPQGTLSSSSLAGRGIHLVRISLERTSGALPIRILVEDDGPGIPPDELDSIFVPFHRVESARERTSADEGTGLGLAIARRAVTLHGGVIRARNRATGGLAVEILLPE